MNHAVSRAISEFHRLVFKLHVFFNMVMETRDRVCGGGEIAFPRKSFVGLIKY